MPARRPPIHAAVALAAALAGLLAGLAPAPAASAAPDASCAGLWSGELVWRETPLPLRLAVAAEPAGLVAELDLPELVYAGEPLDARAVDGGCEVDLPFGLGTVALRRDGERLAGEGSLADEPFTVRLAADPEPVPRRREVAVPVEGATLAGTLYLPPGPGPHPAVALLHGSSEPVRSSWSYRSWADAFARRGVAALAFDRRGGADAQPDLATLADDAVAVVDFLAAQPEIDGRRVGLTGGSQGGWLAMAAAAASERVRFLVLRSTPAVTPATQDIQRVEATLRRRGAPEEEVQDAVAYQRLYFSVVHTGRGWEALAREAEAAAGSPWGELVDQPRTLDDLAWWRRNHALSPPALLAGRRAAVLSLHGEADTVVPAAFNADPMRRLLAASEAPYEVLVFPGADHRLEVPPGRDADGRWRWFSIAPGLLDGLERWLDGVAAPEAVPEGGNPPPAAP